MPDGDALTGDEMPLSLLVQMLRADLPAHPSPPEGRLLWPSRRNLLFPVVVGVDDTLLG